MKKDKWWAYAISTGAALSPIHNVWLTNLTSVNDEPYLFIPQVGFYLITLGSMFYVLRNWEDIKDEGFGNSWLVWALLLIIFAIGLSGVNYTGVKIAAPLLTGVMWAALYLSSRRLGPQIFKPLAIGAAVASVGVIISAIIHPGELTGGLLFEYNYDIVVGYILLGAVLYSGRYRFPLIALSVTAIFLTGSPEGVFALFVLLVVVIIRKDIGRRVLYATVPLVIIAALWLGLGFGQNLYSYAFDITRGNDEVITKGENSGTALGYRLSVIGNEMAEIEPLGIGYTLTEFKTNTVHNVPLIIVQQLGWPGIIASLCWLAVGIAGWRIKRWRYAWSLVFGLVVFDHFIWTQLAPYWWMLVGVGFKYTEGNGLLNGA